MYVQSDAVRLGTSAAILCLAGSLGLCLPGQGACGDAPAVPVEDALEPRTGLLLSAGGAWAVAPFLGGVHEKGRGTAIVELQLQHTLKVNTNVAFDYLAGVVPLELQTGTVVGNGLRAASETGLRRATVYGVGFQPVGIGVRFRRGDWRPFATARGGIRIFTDRVPNSRGSRFNFVGDLGLGVLRRVGPSLWISMHLDLHHVSNGDFAESNPGINQFVLNVGLLRMR